MVERSASKKAFAEALAKAGVDVHKVLGPGYAEMKRAVGDLLARAQKAGTVRRDVNVTEVFALFAGVTYGTERADPSVRRAALKVVFDGLRVQRAAGRGRRP
jgi:hypothetical protein